MESEKALNTFIAKISEAQERLMEIQAYLNNHKAVKPVDVNWGNVGSMGYLLQELTEITDWAYNRGEYQGKHA